MKFPILQVLLVAGALCCAPHVQAEFCPNIAPETAARAEVQQGVEALQKMPRRMREAIIAEKMALLFFPSGMKAYGPEKTSAEEGGAKYFQVLPGAKFVASDGKVYDFMEEQAAALAQYRDLWVQAKTAIGAVGEDAVFSAFEDEVKLLALLAARRHLRAVPTQLRDIWLAEQTGLLYMPTGKTAYYKPRQVWQQATLSSARKYAMTECKAGALFALPQTAKTVDVDVERAKYTSATNRNRMILNMAAWCASVAGLDRTLAAFANEMSALKAARTKAMNSLGIKPVEEAAPLQPRPRSGHAAVTLQGIPRSTRQAIIAEQFDLVYMPDGSSTRDEKGWTRQGARFLSSEGVERDFWKSQALIGGARWQQVKDALRNPKDAESAFATYADEVEAMKQHAQNRMHHQRK